MTYRKITGNRLEHERRKLRSIKQLAIGEISIVSCENVCIVHLRLLKFKNNNLLFFCVNVPLFENIMHLSPVKCHWCFKQPSQISAEMHSWHQYSFCHLIFNMRQSLDTAFFEFQRIENGTIGDVVTKKQSEYHQ